MSRLALAALLTALIASVPAAHAQNAPAAAPAASTTDWTPTLSADLPARLGVQGKRVLVLSGARDDVHSAVARAVRTALSRPGGAVITLDDTAAPDAVGKPDSEALAATAALPVDVRVLVRVLGHPGSRTAVLSVYDPAGAFVTAVSVAEKPAAPVNAVTTPPTATPAAPDSRAGEAAVRAARKTRGERRANLESSLNEAIAAYKSQYIWVESVLSDTSIVGKTPHYYQGETRRPLSHSDLYLAMKETALHKQLHAKIEGHRTSVSFLASAGVGISAAILAAGVLVATTPPEQVLGANTTAPIGGFLAVLGGVGLLFTPLGFCGLIGANETNPHFWPEKPHELHARIKAHNAALAEELGLEDVSGLPTGLERL